MKKLILAMSILTCINSNAQKQRLVNNILIDDYYEGKLQLSEIAPKPYWTLIIINSNLASSNKLLDKLAQRKIKLKSSTILVIGAYDAHAKINHYYTNYQDSLNPYSWISNTHFNILKQLGISATPVVMGMYKDKIAWQLSGFSNSQDFNKLVNHITKWSNNKEIK